MRGRLIFGCLLITVVLLGLSGAKCGREPIENTKKVEQDRTAVIQGKKAAVAQNGNSRTGNQPVDQEASEVTIYFLTENEEHLVPVTIPLTSIGQGAKAAIQRLIVGPGDEFLKPVIQAGTKLRDIYFRDGRVYVDLTSSFTNYPSDRLGAMAVTSILKTLAPFTMEQKVQILIEGNVISKTVGGFDLSQPLALPEPDLMEGEKLITLYYAEPNGLYLVPVKKKIKTPDIVTGAIVELVKGPGEESGLIPTLWHGTKVLGVTVSGDLVEVNLSRQAIGYGGGSTVESLFVRSLLLTMTEIPAINRVQLVIEGEKLELLPEGTEVAKPLTRPEHVNWK